MNEKKLARFLGWFSIGLGLTELVAPGAIARMLGVRDNGRLVRAYGVREIASGIGILAQMEQPAPWIWSRVGGDALDIATLGATLRGSTSKPRNVAIALAAVAGITVLDVLCGSKLSGNGREPAYRRNMWHRDRQRYIGERVGRSINSALGLRGSLG